MYICRLIAASAKADDPIALLQAASRDHIPINPSQKSSLASFSEPAKGKTKVPDSKDRPSIDSVIQEIIDQEWYREQIIERRIFHAKEGTIGM